MDDQHDVPHARDEPSPRRRRARYRGTHPRQFHEKYKELAPERFPEAVERVRERGQTPAGQHVPILVQECLAALRLSDEEWLRTRPGAPRGVDATLGHGGHAEHILACLAPHHGTLVGLDQDPRTLERTAARLAARADVVAGNTPGTVSPNPPGVTHASAPTSGAAPQAQLVTQRTNFAALVATLHAVGFGDGVDFVLADLGVSSMQLDDPARGFSYKLDGPLDMRMNPARGPSAAEWLARVTPLDLAGRLRDDADEPHAEAVAAALCAQHEGALRTTAALAAAVREALPPRLDDDTREQSVRRVFQAIRIAVNDELAVLERLLAQLAAALRPGGRVAFVTFHSGEDRRIKHAFERGAAEGVYVCHSDGVVRPSAAERRANPRSSSAKLRWAERAGTEP